MGRYDSHKNPFQYRIAEWAHQQINNHRQRDAKSIPCHVTKVDKDFITVAFETHNDIMTPPTVKIPQSMSPYGRDPTQVGDRGFASPSDYYLGGVTDDAGGNTNYYPRSNLTALSFQPVSHKKNPERDYDQLTHMGGPKGWIVGPFQRTEPQNQQQNGQGQSGGSGGGGFGGGGSGIGLVRTDAFRKEQDRARTLFMKNYPESREAGGGAEGGSGSGGGTNGQGGQQGGQQKSKTQFSFDKDEKAIVRSKDEDHDMVVDSKNGHAHLQSKKIAYLKSEKVYLGGTGEDGHYAKVLTEEGPCKNVWGKVS